MRRSHSSTILPPDRFQTEHKYATITSNEANRFFYRVSPESGRGAKRRVGFVSSAYDARPSSAPNNTQYDGPRLELARMASAHVTQWKDGTAHLPSPFVSGSFSLPFALFETQRWNLRYGCDSTQISVVDTAKLASDAWLATELVGAWWNQDTFFARWAEEVLVYGCIPHDAVVVTAPLATFFSCLPRWCEDIKPQIADRQLLPSTESVVRALAALARNPDNRTVEAQEALETQSVKRSIAMLRHILPDMIDFDESAHADTVDTVARLAAIFCWWPKWITGTDPLAYPPLLERIEDAVLQEFCARRKAQRRFIASLSKLAAKDAMKRGAESRAIAGVVRSPSTSPRERHPFHTTPRPVRRGQA